MQAQMLAEMKRNYQNLADSQWVVAQQGDQAIRLVMDWCKVIRVNYAYNHIYVKSAYNK